MAQGVDQASVLRQVSEAADSRANYLVMVAIAAGIAVIGLLLNSPAVIIGAMLVSPLMGPIAALGFALAMLDVGLGRRAVVSLLTGAVLAVAVGTAVTWCSPVNEFTSELLARTRPSLFDLVVAILSGLAGGYALIRGLGGTAVGVAIATALMPPLTTVGYGLATAQWSVLRGALLLFVTNLTAIALSVAAVALWFGFGRGAVHQRFARQALVSLLLLVPLAVPLSVSLRGLVWEGRVQAAARQVLDRGAASLPAGQLAQFRVRFTGDQQAQVEAIVVSARLQAGFERQMQQDLSREAGAGVRLHLTQLKADDPEAQRLIVPGAAEARAAPVLPLPDPTQAWRTELALPLAGVELDEVHHRATLHAQAASGIGLVAWQAGEARLAAQHPGWDVRVVPPPGALPRIDFAPASAQLDASALATLDLVRWTLVRWDLPPVVLSGHASSEGRGTAALARQRVAVVQQALAAAGVSVSAQAVYPVPNQPRLEREQGEALFRSVWPALAPTP